jgi:hypothetical protein
LKLRVAAILCGGGCSRNGAKLRTPLRRLRSFLLLMSIDVRCRDELGPRIGRVAVMMIKQCVRRHQDNYEDPSEHAQIGENGCQDPHERPKKPAPPPRYCAIAVLRSCAGQTCGPDLEPSASLKGLWFWAALYLG